MMVRFLFCLPFWLIAFLSPSFAQSVPDTLQVTTAENSSGEDEEDPAYPEVAESEQDSTQQFFVRFNTDGTASTGNVERVLLQLSSALDWKPSRQFKLSSSPSFIYGTQSNVLAEREFFADIRGSFWHQKQVYGLAFLAWDRSNLRHILNRWTQAAGIGVKIIQRKRAYFSVTNLLLHEVSDFAERADLNVWRNSTRLLGEFAPDKKGKFTITGIVFLQPAISMRNNFRWNGSLAFAYKMSSNLSLRTKFENAYESYVVPGRKTNDFRWTIGLSFQN
ncbi:DUF481 domain-containing protein [Runella slithyformis]|uniref:DUF481 domain-containing protein n=1 Tax=Runella slithyformis (strain ATCC 29530 / DSM 19594 / LMG 11500 / NCIMB 11436 / LSU 4) TaxID=761193 RepID=A0A7U4E4J1_RUNSL|nr:DUF481 domain-containing protein [Runella slithyformis]AEI47478.1 hypothetical protein Runsl_1047 [Runella slithyformis DSM 19594]